MLNRIYPTLTEEDTKLYILGLHRDLDTIDKLVSFASRDPENKKHISFLENYKEILGNHEKNILSAFTELKTNSQTVTNYINENKDNIFDKNIIDINGIEYYFSYFRESYTFFKYLFKDNYKDKNTYGLYTYKYKNNTFYLEEISVDFNNTPVDLISKSPKESLNNLDKMDTATSVNEVLNIYAQGKDDLKSFLATNDTRELFEYEDHNFNSLFGYRPIHFIQENYVKMKQNVVRLELEKHLTSVSQDMIKLLITENTILESKKDRDLFSDDNWRNWQQELLDRNNSIKSEILLKLNIHQDELEKLMSFVDFNIFSDL